MMKRRFSEEQIIGILRQHEGGLTVAEICRQHTVSDASFYATPASMPGKASSAA
jgi:putative transposase